MKLPVVKQEDEQGPWYADGLQFTCAQCGNCCTGGPGWVWVSSIEIDRLAEFLGISRKETIRQYCRKVEGRYSLNEHRTPQGMYDCVFLKDDSASGRKTCSIYPVRPLQCRTWPFWPELLSNKKRWEKAAERCHGMNHGRKFTAEEMSALRDAKDWPERPPTSALKSR